MAGTETVTVSLVDTPSTTDSVTLTVKVDTFTRLLPDSTGTYRLIGGTNQHLGPPLSGTDHNHWGRPDLLSAIRALAKNWRSETGGPLPVNDMSLPTGGLFDINGGWLPAHGGHRNGTNVDISMPVPNPTFVTTIQEQGWWKASDPFLEAGHYHLTVAGTGKVTIRPRRVVSTTWRNVAVRQLTVALEVWNRGGLDASAVSVTGVTCTNGVTALSPFPVTLGGSAIRQIKPVMLVLQVPPGVRQFSLTLAHTATPGAAAAWPATPLVVTGSAAP